MLFPKTLQLDASDQSVFDRAARPGEWAIPGTFLFAHDDPELLAGKRLQAFRNGFLGTDSFGWSTLVEIRPISDAEYAQVERSLAQFFVDELGAPDFDTALVAAREEARFAAELCEHPAGTLMTLEREFQGLKIVERFGAIQRDNLDHSQVRLWAMVEDGD